MQLSRTAYRAALFHLSVNPVFARASIQPTWSLSSNTAHLTHSVGSTSTFTSSSSSRLYSILFPECIANNTKKNNKTLIPSHTMSTSSTTGNPTSPSALQDASDSPHQHQDQLSPSQTQEPVSQSDSDAQVETQTKKEPLYLPPSSDADHQQSGNIRLDVNSDSGVTLDHLGPMVVNVDGSLSRIGNWAQMAEIERKNTLRIIGKRNKERLAKLRAAEGQ
ncbi:hypothetical protein PDE_09030 [Penicillium oxalicum 114-2]|uniref:Uncharacterized protein n=1 Tax=Penicillium oxalicum (strain 114-2 / CGMCC 5302) TaxID=933388 RepID=S8B5D2_PENO1|nr:hypothetical protein PDE_09030 [Penicillium oxalicum 114-2]